MSKELLFHTAEMGEVLQKEYTKATGLSPFFYDEETKLKDHSHYYIRWLEIRVYELEGRPQPLPPKEYCPGCNDMVQMEDWASPTPYCPDCFDKDEVTDFSPSKA